MLEIELRIDGAQLIARRCAWSVACLALAWLSGCAPTSQDAAGSAGGSDEAVDFLDPDASEEDRAYLEAARPFVLAVAANRPAEAFACLSSHAVAHMSPEQFTPAEDDAEAAAREQQALANVTAEQFAELFQQTVAFYGAPHEADYLVVDSTDPLVLSGQAGDDVDARLEMVLAVGGVPDSLPAGVRRAALSGRISTRLSPEQLRTLAEDYQMTDEELAAAVEDGEIAPYINLKLIVVEEAGQLKIGYFAFRPPSIWD
jgi:hypothetical protein